MGAVLSPEFALHEVTETNFSFSTLRRSMDCHRVFHFRCAAAERIQKDTATRPASSASSDSVLRAGLYVKLIAAPQIIRP